MPDLTPLRPFKLWIREATSVYGISFVQIAVQQCVCFVAHATCPRRSGGGEGRLQFPMTLIVNSYKFPAVKVAQHGDWDPSDDPCEQ